MAAIPSLAGRLVLFDTAVVDVTVQLDDPVELLFGLRLGGGTNIDKALTYARGAITRPAPMQKMPLRARRPRWGMLTTSKLPVAVTVLPSLWDA